MQKPEQFHRNYDDANGDSHSNLKKEQNTEASDTPKKVTGLFTFSGFLLNSPLARSELSIPRDYVFDRYIEIQP
jgi:hypothetical protein